MQKIKSVFVVLHYNEKAFTDTIECVESIHESFSHRNDYRIVVVENGSGDNSGTLLMERLKEDELTDVVISAENLGFARGNNLGCRHAIDQYAPKFLIVINNDTIIKQTDFLDKLYLRYEKEHFDVLGPYIYDRNSLPQNPQLGLTITLEGVERLISANIEHLNKLDTNAYRLKSFIKQRCKKLIQLNTLIKQNLRRIFKKGTIENKEIREELKNVGLHGSALIFTDNYYKNYPDIFYPKTFMFVEEDILYYRILNDRLVSVYYPELEIYHKEDRSTDATLISSDEQIKFRAKNIIKSLEAFRELIVNDGK